MKTSTFMTALTVFILLCTVFTACADEPSTSSGGADIKSFWDSTGLGEMVWWAKRLIYAGLSLEVAKWDFGHLIDNLKLLVLMNPNPRSGDVLNYIGTFIKIVIPLYMLAIAVTGFYLLLISGSPKGRAKAKFLMRDLVVGMVAVSLSPLILQLLVNVSYQATDAVLSQTDIGIVTTSMTSVLGGTDPVNGVLCPLCVLHTFVTFIEIELGYYTFLPFFLVVWGSLVFFFLRFAIISLWMIIFPLSVLLYSFATTRDVGRNMLEQTILWIYMQFFIAVILVAVALCLTQRPAGFMSVGMANDLPSNIVEKTFIWYLPSVLFDFIPFIGCLVMIIAPLLMLRLFKGFLP